MRTMIGPEELDLRAFGTCPRCKGVIVDYGMDLVGHYTYCNKLTWPEDGVGPPTRCRGAQWFGAGYSIDRDRRLF